MDYSMEERSKRILNSFVCYSAGTETKPQMNQDAVRIMKEKC